MTDNHKAHTSDAFQALLAQLGARHILTPPYTPRWNGKLERFNQTLDDEWAHGREWRNSHTRDRALTTSCATTDESQVAWTVSCPVEDFSLGVGDRRSEVQTAGAYGVCRAALPFEGL